MRQLHILFNSAKTWHVIVGWFLCFSTNLPELNLKLFWTSEQNNCGFWLNWIRYGAVSYSLSCINEVTKEIQTLPRAIRRIISTLVRCYIFFNPRFSKSWDCPNPAKPGWKWAGLALLFSRQLLNSSHDFFQTSSICVFNYFIKNPQTTIALPFLTHNISAIGGVYGVESCNAAAA